MTTSDQTRGTHVETPAMSSKPTLTPSERADLVAYLDGELDPTASRQLEAKLQRDPAARAEAETLRKAWELLDCLPRPMPSATFTERTVQRVSAGLPIVRLRGTKTWRSWMFGVGWTIAVLVAGALGYAGGRLLPHVQSPSDPGRSASDADARPPRASEAEQAWLDGLPRAERERVQKVEGAERTALIASLRMKEEKREKEWQRAVSHWEELARGQHTYLGRLPVPIRIYVDDFLRPLLSAAEQKKLREADGTPELLPMIRSLARKHPVILPGPRTGIDAPRKLPPGLWQQLVRKDSSGLRKYAVDGRFKWPDFAVWVSYSARREHLPLPKQLGPCRPLEFDTVTQTFIWDLLARVNAKEKKQLEGAEGNWPTYPRILGELAVRHGMKVPGGAPFSVPGPADFWDWWETRPKRD